MTRGVLFIKYINQESTPWHDAKEMEIMGHGEASDAAAVCGEIRRGIQFSFV